MPTTQTCTICCCFSFFLQVPHLTSAPPAQDILGAPVEVDDFVVAGTSAQSLYGTCEAFFRPGMEREELFRVASRCLLSALERDCLSGYGAVVHLITEEGIETRELTTRMD